MERRPSCSTPRQLLSMDATTKAYYDNLPRKWMGAAVLFLTHENDVLIVKPTYRDEWLLPGGVVEAGESPRHAAEREVAEELGSTRGIGRLLCVDYIAAGEAYDNVQYVFLGEPLSRDMLAATEGVPAFVMPSDELSTCAVVSLDEAQTRCGPRLGPRIEAAFEGYTTGTTRYLENGVEV